jgi:hypothetical protein
MQAQPDARFTGRVVGWCLLAVVLFVQSYLFCEYCLQPFRYDAISYHLLAHRLQFSAGVPLLGDAGFRSYGYPLLLKPLLGLAHETYLYAVGALQCLAFAVLMLVLRAVFLPSTAGASVTLAGLLLLFPVLPPYCVVLLSDAAAAVCLQFGLLLLAASSTKSNWRSLCVVLASGFLLGYSVQIRPPYYYFVLAIASLYTIFVLGLAVRTRPFLRWWTGSFQPAMLALGCMIAFYPTIANNLANGDDASPLPQTDSLFTYHLTLGLALDKWSSYDPPDEEFYQVTLDWSDRGWSVVREIPHAPPTMDDFWRQVRADRLGAFNSGVRHVLAGFEKWDVYPYRGHADWWARVWIWVANWGFLAALVYEGIRRALGSPSDADRKFAVCQCLLMGYLAATMFIIVPEERFTLALYPAALVYATAILERWWNRPPALEPGSPPLSVGSQT